MLQRDDLPVLAQALEHLDGAFAGVPGTQAPDADALRRVLIDLAERLRDSYPFHSPSYAGQMLKPPHPVARLAYQLTQWINPNNHALDGGPATSALEKEAVAELAGLFGWRDRHLGHLAAGGTMANLEALWVARERHGAAPLLASAHSHYTHCRLAALLRVEHCSIPTDARVRMDLEATEAALREHGPTTLVATLGTTGYGTVDPLADLVSLARQYGARVHVDAAYGGYFRLLDDLPTAHHFEAASQADSIVIDPHKHGLQPYGCGAVLFRDPGDGVVHAHDSPYTYFSSAELHLGEISLECSRAGAAAAALWATQCLLPYETGGEFAAMLASARAAGVALYDYLDGTDAWLPVLEPDLDILVWAPRAPSLSAMSAHSQQLFDRLAARDIHLALLKTPVDLLGPQFAGVERDAAELVCLRACLMKPEHLDWLPTLIDALESELAASAGDAS
ncbi:MAG: aminotransferase class V-fold PLP-dependent enzyme [Pseudomonadota bacterium]